ncbi:MAG TPA: hypothetical protein VKR83_00300 [Ktedonobacteraceae bacterium]|nr:hypothetical protein [Ktedonobacteraceae bacterium]
MLHPQSPHERLQRDFTPRQSLSIAQIIALGSVDVETVALVWMLLEHGASLTVAGPTEPRPGAGKSTILHALLQFLPESAILAYMSGKYETFAFAGLPDADPAATYAVCNEVSDHQSTYMWGAAARRYLTLPAQGYHVVTSVHADTIDDVLHLYQHDLRLRIEDLRRLGLVVNVGLIGQGKLQRRRWLTTCFLRPQPDPRHPEASIPLLLSRWNASTDTFEHADRAALDELADWAELTPQDFIAALMQRTDCLRELARGQGAYLNQVQAAISHMRKPVSAP